MQKLYQIKKPEKYIGKTTEIFYRSSWEKAFLMFLEDSPRIIKFASEEVVVPYFYLLDKKWHRYYVDFYVELDTGFKYLIEIKPFFQRLQPSSIPKNVEAIKTFIKNQSKWEAATELAKKNGMEFLIFDEYDLKRLGLKIPINSSSAKIKKKLLYESTNKYSHSIECFIDSLLNDKKKKNG